MLQALLEIANDYKFLLGLFLSVPFAIVANLLTPRVDKLLSQWGVNSKAKRRDKLNQEYLQVKQYVENRNFLTEYFLLAIVKSMALGSLVIFWSQFFGIWKAFPLSQLLNLLGVIIIANWNTNALVLYGKVKNFTQYQEEVNKILQK